MPKKFLFFSEMRPTYKGNGWAGGYSVITEGLATALAKQGHEVKILGVNYQGQEHISPFAVIPLLGPEYTEVQLRDIIIGWEPDAVVCLFDLPQHGPLLKILSAFKPEIVSIFPVEGGPVLREWADLVAQLPHPLTISEFGVRELKKAGVKAEFLPVGPTLGMGRGDLEDVRRVRELGEFGEKFIIVKNADNHFRKNWPDTLRFFAKWAADKPDAALYCVTRPGLLTGWDLFDIIERQPINGVRQRGTHRWFLPGGAEIRIVSELTRIDLAWAYNMAAARGCLLQDTGNEGLGMPILEAFWIGLPVVGMNHTAVGELLADGRGILARCGKRYLDPFGNVQRYFPRYSSWRSALDQAYYHPERMPKIAQAARTFIEGRTWELAATTILKNAQKRERRRHEQQ
jgi:glycosyltransferase involved in cell wall biosynthesis